MKYKKRVVKIEPEVINKKIPGFVGITPEIKIKTNNPEMPDFVSISPASFGASDFFETQFKEYENKRLKGEFFSYLKEWLILKNGTEDFNNAFDDFDSFFAMILKYIEEINALVEDLGCQTGEDYKHILYDEIRNVLMVKSPDFFYYTKDVPDESFMFLYKYIYYDLSLVPSILQDDFRRLF